jgi:hypothetical protein
VVMVEPFKALVSCIETAPRRGEPKGRGRERKRRRRGRRAGGRAAAAVARRRRRHCCHKEGDDGSNGLDGSNMVDVLGLGPNGFGLAREKKRNCFANSFMEILNFNSKLNFKPNTFSNSNNFKYLTKIET